MKSQVLHLINKRLELSNLDFRYTDICNATIQANKIMLHVIITMNQLLTTLEVIRFNKYITILP